MKSTATLQVAKVGSNDLAMEEHKQVVVREAQRVGVTNLDLIRAHLELAPADDDSGALRVLQHATHRRATES